MNTLSVVLFNEDVDKFFVPQEHSVQLIGNALSETASEKLIDFHYELINKGVDSMLTWFGKKRPTSQVFEAVFSAALSTTSAQILTFIDRPVDKDWGKNACKLLEEKRCLAVGSEADGTIKSLTGVNLDIPTGHVAAISSPWMLNLDLIRQIARNAATFNVFSEGLNKACKEEAVDFPVFFAYLYLGAWAAMKPNPPLLVAE